MSVSLLSWDRSRPACEDGRPRLDRRRPATAIAGLALLGGLALAIAPVGSAALAVVVAAAGTALAIGMLVPTGVRIVRSRRSAAVILVALLAAFAAWVTIGISNAGGNPTGFRTPYGGMLYSWTDEFGIHLFNNGSAFPTRLGRLGIVPLALALLCSAGGLVLLADAVRGVIGVAVAPRAPWRLLTARPTRRTVVTGSAIAGVALVVASAFLTIGLLQTYTDGDPVRQALVLLGVAAGAALLVGSPVLVGALMRLDRDQAGRAREEERLRFAAHLHDSVLQTLALVQRQAHDPAAVSRLARRQEHALRAWMAGESDLVSETLVAAIREVLAGVEDEHETTIECTAIGDRRLDRGGEALAAAAREALRNAARHAAGAPVVVFCEIGGDRAEVFIRDQGPGFSLADVPAERRGIRDAIVGRMAAAGGEATVESSPGQGTEVALRIGSRGAS
jgi:signal transduction histidine kinase